MPNDSTLMAEQTDLAAKLAITTDPDLRQAIQDRVDALQAARGQAPIHGLAHAVTKGVKK